MSTRLRHNKYLYITVQMRTTCAHSFEFFEYFVNEYTWWDDLYCITNILRYVYVGSYVKSIAFSYGRNSVGQKRTCLDIQSIDDVCKK